MTHLLRMLRQCGPPLDGSDVEPKVCLGGLAPPTRRHMALSCRACVTASRAGPKPAARGAVRFGRGIWYRPCAPAESHRGVAANFFYDTRGGDAAHDARADLETD